MITDDCPVHRGADTGEFETSFLHRKIEAGCCKEPGAHIRQALHSSLFYEDALHWNCSYSGMNVFLSDGRCQGLA